MSEEEPLAAWEEELLNVLEPQTGKTYVFVNRKTRERFTAEYKRAPVFLGDKAFEGTIAGSSRDNLFNREEWTLLELPKPSVVQQVKDLAIGTIFKIRKYDTEFVRVNGGYIVHRNLTPREMDEWNLGFGPGEVITVGCL